MPALPIRSLLACLFAVALCLGGAPARAGPLTVYGAASLTDVLTEIGQEYQAAGGDAVRFSFAASSTLARQIEAGAPADVVALASADWADYLVERGLIHGAPAYPAGNRLVLVAPAGTTSDNPLTQDAFSALLGPDGRIALGDPAHVPAGIYARQALEFLGLWPIAEAHHAGADNVRAALALVARGEAALGVVYATDARIANVAVLATFPDESHDPIVYPFGIVTEGVEARAFLAFATSDAAKAIFRRYGFTVD